MRGLPIGRVTIALAAVVVATGLSACGPSGGPQPPTNPADAAGPGSGAADPASPPTTSSPSSSASPSSSRPTGRPTQSGRTGGPTESAPTYADAPSDNLRLLARALRFKYKSSTGVLMVPPGLRLTAPVEISMLWDERGPKPTRATQDYNNATGNRSLFFYPVGNGLRRPVNNVVTLAERTAAGEFVATYAVRSNVTIEPLYNVYVSNLQFTLLTDCDIAGASEVFLQWLGPSNEAGEYRASTFSGSTLNIAAFAHAYTEVGVSAALQVPVIAFHEEDPGGFYGPPVPNHPPDQLLPGTDHSVNVVVNTGDVNCQGRVQYGVVYRFQEYPYLE
jgi:hypothetical protein